MRNQFWFRIVAGTVYRHNIKGTDSNIPRTPASDLQMAGILIFRPTVDVGHSIFSSTEEYYGYRQFLLFKGFILRQIP